MVSSFESTPPIFLIFNVLQTVYLHAHSNAYVMDKPFHINRTDKIIYIIMLGFGGTYFCLFSPILVLRRAPRLLALRYATKAIRYRLASGRTQLTCNRVTVPSL
jgi:hypothetical protein